MILLYLDYYCLDTAIINIFLKILYKLKVKLTCKLLFIMFKLILVPMLVYLHIMSSILNDYYYTVGYNIK